MGLIADIRDTHEYKTFKKIVSKCEAAINLEQDRSEALALHSGRSSRTLHGRKAYQARALVDASLNDLSCRARLVEIRVRWSMQIDVLDAAVKAIKHFIDTEYNTRMKKAFTTVGDRKAFVERVIKAALTVQSEGAAFLKVLDTLIGDCDKASFHLRTMQEGLTLMMSPKGGTL